jgi:hypothetical protein
MSDKGDILKKRLNKLEKHYVALKEYKRLIDDLVRKKNIYDIEIFESLEAEERAILDAYLKRFSSLQDFLGAKIFNLLLDISGISYTKMSEVLYYIEKEGIIDSLGDWIELREVRNELEHDYPEELEDALEDLKFCINSFKKLESYYLSSLEFAKRYIK